MDAAFDENEAELGVLVLAITLEMFADGDCLLYQVEQVLRDLGSQAVLLQDAQDLRARYVLNLRDAVRVSEQDADLGRGHAFPGQLADLLREVLH